LTQVRFETGNYPNDPNVWSVLDNVTVTRPSSGPEKQLQLFWTEVDLGQIQTAYEDGSGQGAIVSGLDRPIGIELDQENGYVYFAEEGVSAGSADDGRITRANLDGAESTVLYSAADGDIGLADPQHIALDTAGGFIYWTDLNSGVYRGPLD